MTARQTKNPPVGTGEAFFVPFVVELMAPWLVIAMTDGVWKYAGWRRIKEAASRLRGRGLIDRLQTPARLPGSGEFQDDFTLSWYRTMGDTVVIKNLLTKRVL